MLGALLEKDFSKMLIVASDDINEARIKEFNAKNHSIDIFGIGTNLVTCQKQPALGMVFKLQRNDGEFVMKLSKSTLNYSL